MDAIMAVTGHGQRARDVRSTEQTSTKQMKENRSLTPTECFLVNPCSGSPPLPQDSFSSPLDIHVNVLSAYSYLCCHGRRNHSSGKCKSFQKTKMLELDSWKAELILTSACPLSGESILLKIMAGAAVSRTEKSVRIGVRMARRSWCLLTLYEHKPQDQTINSVDKRRAVKQVLHLTHTKKSI